jgi:hypothetical protein
MKLIQPQKKKIKEEPTNKRPNCWGCKHYFITWDMNRPYGCHALNFKSKTTPSLVVFQSSGMQCQMFSPKKK